MKGRLFISVAIQVLLGILYITSTTALEISTKHDLSTPEMIMEAGYPFEGHVVSTEDCYLLSLHRLPNPNGNGKVVFLQHGLIASSSDWVIAGPDHGGLAFVLWNAGYDVWLGNFRGNTYSRSHCTLNPDQDEFWQFTWDEIAKFDLPAELNYVLDKTGVDKLFYVGHSMGSTTFMVMNSLDATWADKVELATFFAPIAHVEHMLSPIRFVAPFAGMIDWIAEHMGLGEFMPSNWIMNILADLACSEGSWFEGACENLLFIICGFDEAQTNSTMMETILNHTPAGTSTFTVLQYAQGVNSKKFMGFDWGNDEDNILHHGTKDPPQYDLTAVNARVALYWSDGDWLAQPEDLLKLFSQLPNIYKNYQVPFCGWNHLDYLWGIEVNKYVNYPFLEMIEHMQ